MSYTPNNPWPLFQRGQHPALIVPSLLAVDFANPAPSIDSVLSAGAKVLHVDIMDGHFVPNLSMGTPVMESFRRYTNAPLDVHLMVTDPGLFIPIFAAAGADSLNFHIEACQNDPTDPQREAMTHIQKIRELGCGVGITIKPQTPISAIESVVDAVDFVLVMTVEPGFGGQSFLANQLPKIESLRSLLRDDQRIEVDGGISTETISSCFQAGADTFVTGNAVFGASDPGAAVQQLRGAIR